MKNLPKRLFTSWSPKQKACTLSCHIVGKRACLLSAIIRISRVSNKAAAATVDAKWNTELYNSTAASQCLSHREPSPIKTCYLQGSHLLPTGEEIAAYLLVNNKKRHIMDKKKPSYHDGKREVRKKGRQGSREISRDSFILWKGQAERDLPL